MKKYKKGVAFGTWDCFHFGHLNILREAKKHCKELIVGIDTDKYALKKKGKTTFHNYIKRKENIKTINLVDYIEEQTLKYQKQDLIIEHEPDVIFVGSDHMDSNWEGEDLAEAFDLDIFYIGESIIHSSEIKKIIANKIK